jgi:putative addiction module component (TIGR02574 family)
MICFEDKAMSNQSQMVLDAALTLPEIERAALIRRLAESLSPETERLLDEDFINELERRSAEFEQGTADPVSWEQLKTELLAELDGLDLSSAGEQGSPARD